MPLTDEKVSEILAKHDVLCGRRTGRLEGHVIDLLKAVREIEATAIAGMQEEIKERGMNNSIYTTSPISIEQFRRACAVGAVSPLSKGYLAAYLVMVKGESASSAARKQSISRAAVHYCIERVRNGLKAENKCPCCGAALS